MLSVSLFHRSEGDEPDDDGVASGHGTGLPASPGANDSSSSSSSSGDSGSSDDSASSSGDDAIDSDGDGHTSDGSGNEKGDPQPPPEQPLDNSNVPNTSR